MGGVTGGMPADQLIAGKRFSVEYAPVEREFSRKAGDRVSVTLWLIAA